MKKRISALTAAVLAILLLASCAGTAPARAKKPASVCPPKSFPLGTAKTPEGKTVVITVLAGDAKTSWNPRSAQDAALRENARANLGTACRWITAQAKKWNRKTAFVYDWNAHPDLIYAARFSSDFTDENSDADPEVWRYIGKNIPTRALMKRYGASNAVFVLLVNTPSKNTETSCTRNWYEGMESPYEICYMLLREEGEEEPPAAYAHEILHTFGAVDLYDTSDENLGATKKFVRYIGKHDANDIMYTVYNEKTGESEYDRISNRLTALDAYYIGWTDSCPLVKEWNLLPSQHG